MVSIDLNFVCNLAEMCMRLFCSNDLNHNVEGSSVSFCLLAGFLANWENIGHWPLCIESS